MRTASSQLPQPTRELIHRYLEKWETLENYRLQETSLDLLFRKLFPDNRVIEHVLLKVTALNAFYSTNIYDTFTTAKHILTQDVDSRLKRNDLSLVHDIAKVTIKERRRNFYSFASKYCSHHSPDRYPIYDSFVEKMLLRYGKKDRFEKFKQEDLKRYERFVGVIESFRKHFGLETFSLKQIDIFLWLAGKEHFPAYYARHKDHHPGERLVSQPPRLPATVASSKYDELRKYLERQGTNEVTFQFKNARAVLGFPLPPSAHKHQAFWANQSNTTNRPWAKAWQSAGYEVVSHRLSGNDGWVRFRRVI